MKNNENKYISVHADALDTKQMHKYLLGGIAPRPIAFVSTKDAQGNVNLSPFSFFNAIAGKKAGNSVLLIT